MGAKYLKTRNLPTTTVCLLWSIAVFLAFFNGVTDFWGTVTQRLAQIQAKDSLLCFLTPLILSVAAGLLPSNWKATLVFWRFRNVLPGCRAFSRLAKGDPRIDQGMLKASLGACPRSPAGQNATWFRWYKTVEEAPTVQAAHRQFLLNRDLAGISFLFLVLGIPSLLFSHPTPASLSAYAAILGIQYVLFALVARNHGNRFVCNVIVEYLSRETLQNAGAAAPSNTRDLPQSR